MTLNEIAYNIKNIAEGGISGEDSNLSIRQIYEMIHYHRAQALMKYTDNGRYLSNSVLQLISGALGSGFLNIGCNFLGFPHNRAVASVELYQSEDNIIHVGLVNKSDRQFFEASRFTPNRSQHYAVIEKQTNGNPRITVYDNDGEVFSDSNYTLRIMAVVEDPTEISGFASASSPYPIPAELIESLTESILAKEFNIYLKTSSDVNNNSVDDSGIRSASTQPVATQPSANARSKRARTR